MTKIDFQNLRSNFFWQNFEISPEISKFSFFKLIFRRFFFEKKVAEIFFRDQKFSEKKSSKNQFKKWKFWNFEKSSENFQNFVNFFFRSQILKMDFRHENLIFFIQIFFPDKVWSYYIGKQHRRWAYLTYHKNGTGKRPRTLEIRQVVILFRERLQMCCSVRSLHRTLWGLFNQL